MSIADARRQAIDATIAKIREIEQTDGVTPAALEKIRDALGELAAHDEYFPLDDFPAPPPGKVGESVRYQLHEEDDKRFALYLNSINPGKSTHPHNHDTWAVVVAVDGNEINRVYERTDDGSEDGKATLKQVREVDVVPGTGICLMPDHIHSIHTKGDKPTRHLHMYGRALDTLTGRLGFDLEEGTVTGYNKAYMNDGATGADARDR